MKILINEYPELDIEYNEQSKNIRIINSYTIINDTNKKIILQEINYQLKNQGIIFKRTINSQLNEWKGHNIMYQWHLFRSRSANVDINENESLWRRICYTILSIFERGK